MSDQVKQEYVVESSKAEKSIQELTQTNRTLKSELDKVKSSVDDNATAQEKAEKVAKVLKDQISNQKDYVEKLKKDYDELTETESENSIALSKQKEKINKAETALNKMTAELIETEKASSGAGEEAENFSTTMEKMKAAEVVAEVLGKFSDALAKVGGAAYDSAKELDEGYDTIIKKTGATGDNLKDLQKSANNVFGSMPTDMADVGTAVGEINTRFGSTGEELEGLSELFLQFSEITDTDVNSAIGTTSRLLKTYGGSVKDANKVLGYFAKQSQATGVDTTTLMQSLDKNGATLREMGLDLQQSTKLLALFEENGVDSAGAMTGLRKAVINGAKAGKSFDQVMAEASASIKSASTDAEALEIATELFGTKGAVVMADGLRSGRISLDNLSESMAAYGNVVQTTFEETLDPWDKAKVAINNVKMAGSELVTEALSTLEPVLNKVVEGIQGAVKWFQDLPEPIKKVVAVLGGATVAAGALVPKVQGILSVIGQFNLASSINGLTGLKNITDSTGNSTSKLAAIWGAMTSPIGLATGAVALAGAALAGLALHTQAAIEAEYGLTNEQKQAIETINAEYQAYTNLVQARTDAVAAADAEFGHIDELKNEYNELIDASGRVKEGYESRANYILGELSKATGISIEQLQNEAREYGYLGQSIDQVIEKKRLEAMTSAYMESYTEALQSVRAAQDNYAEAVEIAAQREADYQKVVADTQAYSDQRKAIEDQMALLDPYSEAYTQLAQSLASLDEQHLEDAAALRTSKKAYDDATAAVDNAWETYNGYQETIDHYEGAQAAIMSGEEKEVRKALKRLEGDYSDAEKNTKKELEKILKDAEANLTKTAKAVNAGKLDKAALREAQAAVDAAKSQLANFRGVGRDIDNGLAEGMEKNKGIPQAKAKELGLLAVDKVAEGAQTHSPSRATLQTGKDIDEGLKQGLDTNKGAVTTSAKNVATETVGKITAVGSDASIKAAGQKATDALKAGIDGGKEAIKTAANAVSTTAKTGLATDHREAVKAAAGKNAAAIKAGLDAQKAKAKEAAELIAKTAKDGMATDYRTALKSAAEANASALASGINAKKGDVSGAASGISGVEKDGLAKDLRSANKEAAHANVVAIRDAINAQKNAVRDAAAAIAAEQKKASVAYSTSKTWGSDMVSGLAKGMEDSRWQVRKQSQLLAQAQAEYLKHSTPDKGPLHGDDQWGYHLVDNILEGMEAGVPELKSAALGLASAMQVPTLELGVGGIHGASTFRLDYDALYSAVSAAMSEHKTSLVIGNREFGRILREATA